MSCRRQGNNIIAVHAGAGHHSFKDDRKVKHALRLACSQAFQQVEQATQMVESAISVLEDDGLLNAGYGSNLTMDGTVECDASLMNGENGRFGGVSAVSGVKNPISLARAIMDNASRSQPLGLVPPLILTGYGAHSFASTSGLQLVDPMDQISPRAKDDWVRWKALLDSNAPLEATEELRLPLQDTVGAIAFDGSGRFAAGVSSGGLLLKHPGRQGEAAVYGAGCWASKSMACSISGTGEQVILSSLAKSLATALGGAEEDTHEVLQGTLEKIYDDCIMRGEDEANVGILLLTRISRGDADTCRLWCAFTTESMAIAYITSDNSRPTASILRNTNFRAAPHNKPSLYITALPLS